MKWSRNVKTLLNAPKETVAKQYFVTFRVVGKVEEEENYSQRTHQHGKYGYIRTIGSSQWRNGKDEMVADVEKRVENAATKGKGKTYKVTSLGGNYDSFRLKVIETDNPLSSYLPSVVE